MRAVENSSDQKQIQFDVESHTYHSTEMWVTASPTGKKRSSPRTFDRDYGSGFADTQSKGGGDVCYAGSPNKKAKKETKAPTKRTFDIPGLQGIELPARHGFQKEPVFTLQHKEAGYLNQLNVYVPYVSQSLAYEAARRAGGGAEPRQDPPHKAGDSHHFHAAGKQPKAWYNENCVTVEIHYQFEVSPKPQDLLVQTMTSISKALDNAAGLLSPLNEDEFPPLS